MVFGEDDRPVRRPAYQIGQDLGTFSVEELEELLGELSAEIERVKAALGGKRASRSAADSVFML